MSEHPHFGHGIGVALIVGAIAFAFGMRTARVIVGAALILAIAFLAFVIIQIERGAI